MEKKQVNKEISTEVIELTQQLHALADEASRLEKRIIQMPIVFHKEKSAGNTPYFSSAFRHLGHKAITAEPSKIIPFPGSGFVIRPNMESRRSQTKQSHLKSPLLALPGRPLPPGIPDYRLALQRDGLILLGWDKRVNETGERYTAYWVTSTGIPRYYASKMHFLEDFPHARPDHKSYAAEDGIEFYGQQPPAYIVHVAPELMMSNPMHDQLRAAHINKLKNLGITVNFDYKYLLKTEKKRNAPSKRDDNGPQDWAG